MFGAQDPPRFTGRSIFKPIRRKICYVTSLSSESHSAPYLTAKLISSNIISLPLDMSSSNSPKWPWNAAKITGVFPEGSHASIAAPQLSSVSVVSHSPWRKNESKKRHD